MGDVRVRVIVCIVGVGCVIVCDVGVDAGDDVGGVDMILWGLQSERSSDNSNDFAKELRHGIRDGSNGSRLN